MEKPIELAKSIWFLWLSLALWFTTEEMGVIRILSIERKLSVVLVIAGVCLLFYGLAALLVARMSAARNWARVLSIVWFSLLTSQTIKRFQIPSPLLAWTTLPAMLGLAAVVFEVIGFSYLYRRGVSNLFRESGARAAAEEATKIDEERPSVGLHKSARLEFRHSVLMESLSIFFVASGATVLVHASLHRPAFIKLPVADLPLLAAIVWLTIKHPGKAFSLSRFWRNVALGLGLGGILPLLKFMGYLAGPMARPDDYALFLACTSPQKILWVLATVAIAPAAEEALFRGCFYRLLSTYP
jgi:hypothetical protein